MKKITDFGNTIPGARKDMYVSVEAALENIRNMDEANRIKAVTKERLWPLKSNRELVEKDGYTPFIAEWIREVRKKIIPSPANRYGLSFEKYTEYVYYIKDMVMAVRSEDDVNGFYTRLRNLTKEENEIWYSVSTPMDIRNLRFRHNSIRIHAENSLRKSASPKKKRKEAFIPPQLEAVRREGSDYRHGVHVTPEKWQEEFKFYGVQFGNWMSQADRQVSMDYCYDALLDMCRVLKTDASGVAFNGWLGIAFGARGISRAMAHYEPLMRVINLTKLKGAGSLAHEWFHALDHYIALRFGVTDGKLASEAGRRRVNYKPLWDLFETCVFTPDRNYTEFFRSSRRFDVVYSKESHGYWSSNCELLARAFACYCADRYGKRNDYLFGQSDSAQAVIYGNMQCAYPVGEERERINKSFDSFFEELRNTGILPYKDYGHVETSENEITLDTEEVTVNFTNDVETGGQFTFKF